MAARILPIGLLLLAVQQTAAQGPSPTSNFSLSVTSQSPSASVTEPPCCFYIPMTVGLNVWWTSSFTATVATVVTEYLQYNNTVIPNATSTIYNEVKPDDFYTSISTDLLPGVLVYERTAIHLTTVLSDYWGDSVMSYPTPFVEVHQIAYADGGIGTDTAGAQTCTPAPFSGDPQSSFYYLSEGYVFAPETTAWTGPANDVEAPTGVLDAWIAQTPDITSKIPWLKKCSSLPGSGEPSIHVPVTALTEHSKKTIQMTGVAPGQPDQPAQSTAAPELSSSRPPIATQPIVSNPFPRPTRTSGPQPNPQTSLPGSPDASPQPNPNPNPETPNPGNQNPGNQNPGNQNPGNQNPGSQNPGNQNPGNQNPGNPDPNNPGANVPSNSPQPSPILPGPSLPIPVIPAPNNPGVVVPGGPTLTPGITTTISDHEIIVPSSPPTGVVVLPGGETLSPGSTTTISGTEVFVPTDTPSVIVVGGTAIPAPTNIIVVDGTTVPVPAPIDSSSTELDNLYTPTTIPPSPTGSTSNGAGKPSKPISGLPGEFTGAAAATQVSIWGAGALAIAGAVILI
ncbi:uncharacterized protein EI97DRAFT_8100 [Westerdykella ornata]|uniref:Uncharacterized protein n=1 Tax=Westerdykella ornata TaxID=318751 RepID=A0A6A6JVX3_WESOR|nr:uncharacterized protein EI97DRAFT_8100 [Westerdykella ornata]KAF2280770.1 hypothetical protein EI97DRAFT_8100 [Westerdykella ornata]